MPQLHTSLEPIELLSSCPPEYSVLFPMTFNGNAQDQHTSLIKSGNRPVQTGFVGDADAEAG